MKMRNAAPEVSRRLPMLAAAGAALPGQAAAGLYAAGRDLGDPLLSPINGDFHGFPPAMLTAGTRDLFLSDTARTHWKLRQSSVAAGLQVFEAQSHFLERVQPGWARSSLVVLARFTLSAISPSAIAR